MQPCEVPKHVAAVTAMAHEAAQHKVECSPSATLSDHDDGTGTPSSPARSPDSHTTNIGTGALSNGAAGLPQGARTCGTVLVVTPYAVSAT